MRLAVVDGVVVVTLVRPDGAEARGVVPPSAPTGAPGRALKPRTLRMAGARVGRRSRKRAVHAAVSVLALISRHRLAALPRIAHNLRQCYIIMC